jgi:hypothetical protein
MTNRLLSVIAAAALALFVIALRPSTRKIQPSWEQDEHDNDAKANVPGYSFSLN